MLEEMLPVIVGCTGVGEDATWLVNCTVNTGDFDAKMDDDWFCDDGGEVTDDDGKTDILLELEMETLELDMETAAQTEKSIKDKYIKYHSMQIFPPFHWPRAHCVTCK